MNAASSAFIGVFVSLVVGGCRQISSNDSIQRNQNDKVGLVECLFPMKIMDPRLLNEVVVVKDSISTNGYILAYDYVNTSMGDISSYAIEYHPNKIEIRFGWSFQPDQWIKFEMYEEVKIIRIPRVMNRKICITDGLTERDLPRDDTYTEKDLWRLLGISERIIRNTPDDPWK